MKENGHLHRISLRTVLEDVPTESVIAEMDGYPNKRELDTVIAEAGVCRVPQNGTEARSGMQLSLQRLGGIGVHLPGYKETPLHPFEYRTFPLPQEWQELMVISVRSADQPSASQ
jgi:hypothetical protein